MRTKNLFFKVLLISAVLMVTAGCANNTKQTGSEISSTPSTGSALSSASSAPSSDTTSAVSSTGSAAATSSAATDEAKALLTQIMDSAKKGKIINSEFGVKSSVIEDITEKWGKADKTEYVASAKGNYSTFSKQKAAFGFNKGDQIFEARSFDSKLSSITMSKAKEVFGKPAYTSSNKTEDVLGYVVSKEYKLLLVFTKTNDKADPVLDHYSVFYPAGTVNNMADDPGREW